MVYRYCCCYSCVYDDVVDIVVVDATVFMLFVVVEILHVVVFDIVLLMYPLSMGLCKEKYMGSQESYTSNEINREKRPRPKAGLIPKYM